ncbi:MAG: DUF1232 domain-containing protein [Alphaproteobacteria bacterium]|jgi:uncharacterized membrane protein YkvA (DUF1232 family)|nr:DUF1232 domain-containing protein [Alphaproteobacteria bacterium]
MSDDERIQRDCDAITALGWRARVGQWARHIKRDIMALWIAARDPRTPLAAKVVAGVIAAYALSPIDLIPDFVPVLGYLDDIIIVAVGIILAARLIPVTLLEEFRARAAEMIKRPISRAGLAIIITIWITATGSLLWWALPSATS